MPLRRSLDLTDLQRADLLHYRDHDPRPYVRERCAAILKVADGQSAHAVACQGLLKPRDPDTLYSWLNHYEEAGLDGLLGYQQGGSRRRGL
jgi:transposase